ncbi:MAG: TetR family transcriptional regulator, partial [Actinobacteria bacterium]
MSETMTQAPSRREKHKTQTRQVLRETALQLFASQGYDSTTAEE